MSTTTRAVAACSALLTMTIAGPTLAQLSGAPRAAVPETRRFEERKGVLEFTGQLIVRPARNLAPADDARARAMLDGRVLKFYPEVDEYVVDAGAARSARGEAENALSASLMQSGLFQYAVPNWLCFPLDTTPNDPLFGSQWHHSMMRSPQGWDISTGDPSLIVAVTDTGIDLTHPDLAPKHVPGFDAFNDQAEVDGGSVADINGHGTHVAGCAAAIGNNAQGVAGVNWNARIMMVRVAIDSSGSAYYDDLLQGARWAIEHGARTVSASYSGVAFEPIQTTGAYIKSIGGLYFYAAGNDSADLAGFDWQDVVVVGASDESDNRAWFSAYGHAVDVFSPGVNILSSCNGGGYCYASGTSMATPVANGVASLLWAVNPNLTPDQVQTLLFSSCHDLGAPGEDEFFGWGRVDVFSAAAFAAGTLAQTPPHANDDSSYTVRDQATTVDVLFNDFDFNGDPMAITAFSATSAAGGAITRSAGTGPGGRDELRYSPPAGFTGADSFTYTVSDAGGGTVGTVTMTVYDPAVFRDADQPGYVAGGLPVEYYVTQGYSLLPDFSTLTPYARGMAQTINFPSTDGNFAGSGRAEEVGAVFTGYVEVDQTGFYTLYTNSDDGSKLYIGNQLVVNNDGLHGMVEVGGQIGLKAGRHAVRVEFWENFGGAGLIASIAGPGLSKRVIPASRLWHAACGPDFNDDGFVDFFDLDLYLSCFELGECPVGRSADFNDDRFVDFFDFDAFIQAFESGC